MARERHRQSADAAAKIQAGAAFVRHAEVTENTQQLAHVRVATLEELVETPLAAELGRDRTGRRTADRLARTLPSFWRECGIGGGRSRVVWARAVGALADPIVPLHTRDCHAYRPAESHRTRAD